MTSDIGDVISQLRTLQESLPITSAEEYSAALEAIHAQAQAALRTFRDETTVLTRIQHTRDEGVTEIHTTLITIDQLIGHVVTSL
ncbi:hypothetical protein FHR81_003197 [Actinoalloteichus hoggarensis]|uniref:Uncharacterized protein n=1 Tax=Actinoalloteichus hoggarensis TaxID=1470176 RepID=A0A221W723_9PSEU|nr:hypothetical protein [Actinoalloteichus hoggarensis]ASO21554.1 hypothetical protein AHOG_19680 [Actinoalloteichus hoggarensis]MBB5922145.1 hypothetical protein [Actinoalloteichus hoggarensis]